MNETQLAAVLKRFVEDPEGNAFVSLYRVENKPDCWSLTLDGHIYVSDKEAAVLKEIDSTVVG